MELRFRIRTDEGYLEVDASKKFNEKWSVQARICLDSFLDDKSFCEKALKLLNTAREALAKILVDVEGKLREGKDEG